MEPLNRHIYITANTLARKMSRLTDEHFKPFGFSSSYAFLLIALYRKSGMGQKEIGTLLHLAPSTVTRFVDKLERMKLVERTLSGNKSEVTLTSEGSDVAGRLEKELLSLSNRITDSLGSRYYETLGKMLNYGISLMDADGEEGSGS